MCVVNFDQKGQRSAGDDLAAFFAACARILEDANDGLTCDDFEVARDVPHGIEEAAAEARVALCRRSGHTWGAPVSELRPYAKDHLTRAYGEDVERRIDLTHRGQAHWAGTGPEGATCAICRLLVQRRGGKGRCLQFTRLMRGREGSLIPATAASCKLYEAEALQ